MKKTNMRKAEKGNVLFLILIAVALFAALSYVVTQSTRSGGGSTEREKNILSSASMTQYPTALRTAVTRMVLNGIALENIRFNAPANFSAVQSTNTLVFHPEGGGAVFQEGPADLSVSGNDGLAWSFNMHFQIPEVGTTDAGTNSANDLVAFLPGVSDGICRQVNEEVGIRTTGCTMTNNIPVSNAAEADIERVKDHAYTIPSTGIVLDVTGCDAFARKATGCFKQSGGAQNVFYTVLMER